MLGQLYILPIQCYTINRFAIHYNLVMLIKSHIFWYLGRSKLKLIWNCKPISLGLSVSTSLVTGHQYKRPNNFPGWEDPSVLYGNNPTTTTILIFMQKRTFGIITMDFDNVRGFILHVQNWYEHAVLICRLYRQVFCCSNIND